MSRPTPEELAASARRLETWREFGQAVEVLRRLQYDQDESTPEGRELAHACDAARIAIVRLFTWHERMPWLDVGHGVPEELRELRHETAERLRELDENGVR